MPRRLPPLYFDIDVYLDPLVPRNRLDLLPYPIAYFLGYRAPDVRVSRITPYPDAYVWTWAFLGTFVGLLCVEAVFQTPLLQSEGTPMVVASLGAAAILLYHVPESALSQPRNTFFSQIMAAFIGVAITKLFALSPHFESLRWIAGALSVAVTSSLMGITRTVHPPAGATALLCSTLPSIVALGWFLIPIVILGNSMLIAVACVTMNIQRRYPLYWWTVTDLNQLAKQKREKKRPKDADVEAAGDKTDATAAKASSETDIAVSEAEFDSEAGAQVVVTATEIRIPAWLLSRLDDEEQRALDSLKAKFARAQGLENSLTNDDKMPESW